MVWVSSPELHKKVSPEFPASNSYKFSKQTVVSVGPKSIVGRGAKFIITLSLSEQLKVLKTVTLYRPEVSTLMT